MGTQLALERYRSRVEGLGGELRYALDRTDGRAIRGWATYTLGVLGASGMRRGKRFVKGVGNLMKGATAEIWNLGKAWGRGQAKQHLRERGNALASYGMEVVADAEHFAKELVKALTKSPRETATEMFAGLLGFWFGSGGLDGDGGIPDLDLLGGIGGHRSTLFHSIVAGMAVETATYSVVKLVDVVHGNLPVGHDVFWDNVKNGGEKLLRLFAHGASAGIAWHLLVDATADGGKPYADLPFSMPMEGHQGLMGANAAAEALDRSAELSEGTKYGRDNR